MGEFCGALDCGHRERGVGFVALSRRWLVEQTFAWLLGCCCLSVVTPLSSDDAYRSETLPNSKYGRSNLSPSQDSYADNDAQTNNPQHAHANTDANATSCAQTHTIPQPHPTNTPASQTRASCASNSSDDPAAPRSTAPREPHTDTQSATPTHNAPPHPPPCPDNDA
jgi:hypothetical protein